MVGMDTEEASYVADIAQWRQKLDDNLRSEDGWPTLVGLCWLHEGVNTIGADSNSDILLPSDSAPDHLGTIEFADGQAVFHLVSDIPVTVDSVQTTKALLRDDNAKVGPSLVQFGTITFFVIKRDDLYGIRVRDLNNPARAAFTGRKWFPLDSQYRLTGRFNPHETPRILQIVTSTGHLNAMTNPGRVEFTVHGQTLALEAFASNENEVWFVFKDATSGRSTYGAGRFLYAPLGADGSVILDFNKSYHPPCAFTPYATCPRPPKENILPLEIAAGEHL
jgi:uncharacterized protein